MLSKFSFAFFFMAAGTTAAQISTLTVNVSPVLDPHGSSWRMQLLEEEPDGKSSIAFEGPVRADGGWSADSLRKGRRYRLRLKTSKDEGWYADEKPFEWDETAGARELRLGSSAFRATLFLGRKHLSGRVTFTDRDGLVSVPFATKTDGTFEGLLPRDGWWNVAVSSDRPHFQTTFDVKVDPVFRDGTPPDVDVRVKSRSIQGEIVDLDNRAVPLSSLHVYGGSRFSDDMEVSGGAFRWERVLDGWMTVHASRRGPTGFETSPTRSVHVEGGWVEPGFVALEIRPTYVLKGRTVLPSGEPAAGARIRLFSSHFFEIRTTPADGRFQMTVRGGGENACLLVVDPSKAARLVPVPASEMEQDVPVALSPGTLSLELTPRGERRIGTIVANGCKLSWFLLREVSGAVPTGSATVQRASFRASAGVYAFCALEPWDLDDDGGVPPDACVSGVLAPGGSLNLRLNP